MRAQTIVNRIDPARALAMYDDGNSDGVIAKAFGVDTSSVCLWRKRNGLSRLACNDNRLTGSQVRQAKNLLKGGATKAQVAAHIGVSKSTIETIRQGMDGTHLRRSGISGTAIRARILSDQSLLPRIERAIGYRAPLEVRREAVNEMYLDLLEGKLPIDQVEAAAPRYRSRAFSMAGYNYSARSIDEENEDGFSLADTLADPMSMRPFDEVLERVFANDD